jgi:hypothetical protein
MIVQIVGRQIQACDGGIAPQGLGQCTAADGSAVQSQRSTHHAVLNHIDHHRQLVIVGHNFIEIVDMKRITDRLDNNLKAFEQRERRRREEALGEDERLRRIREAEEVSHWVPLALGPVHCLTLLFARLQEKKRQEDLAKWLEETRDERAENRRQREVYFA